MAANFDGPIPGTFNRSSTFVNGPFDVRYAMMARAVAGPTPVNVSSCVAVAELMLIVFDCGAEPDTVVDVSRGCGR